MQVRWEEEAIAEDNPAASRRVAARILEKNNLLPDHPLLGEPGRIHTTRELVIRGTLYTVIYHASGDTISILRVFHQARRWPSRI
jgi:toxin ParE1/3/4